MVINNPNQPAIGASEAQESNNAAVDSAQPAVVEPVAVAAAEHAVSRFAGSGSADNEMVDNGEMSLEDFGKILAEHEQSQRSEISENEVVKGRVVKITEQAVIIDVGFKSEGIVPIGKFKEGERITIEPGDEVDV